MKTLDLHDPVIALFEQMAKEYRDDWHAVDYVDYTLLKFEYDDLIDIAVVSEALGIESNGLPVDIIGVILSSDGNETYCDVFTDEAELDHNWSVVSNES